MEEHKRPKNIFEEASRIHVRRKAAEKAEASAQPKEPEKSEGDSSSPQVLSNEEVSHMLTGMQNMHRELEEKMEDVIKLSGLPREKVLDFLEDSNNFPPEEWEKLQQKKNELTMMAVKIVGVEDPRRKIMKKEEADTKKLRQKSLGGRKKWIPMR